MPTIGHPAIDFQLFCIFLFAISNLGEFVMVGWWDTTHNPSYIFFRDLGTGPLLGNLNTPITPGRTIALDSRLFPAAAIGWIKTQKPRVNDKGEIVSWEDFSRFVMNQDTGGAIKGPGRADLFWGSGSYAELASGT